MILGEERYEKRADGRSYDPLLTEGKVRRGK
jgi:hypothetical protein